MPYRDATQRVRNYELAVLPDAIRAKFDSRKPAMVDGQEVEQARLTEMEKAVRGILDGYGIAGNFRIPYLNFARELFRLVDTYSGNAKHNFANALRAKYVELGLNTAILDAIKALVVGSPPY